MYLFEQLHAVDYQLQAKQYVFQVSLSECILRAMARLAARRARPTPIAVPLVYVGWLLDLITIITQAFIVLHQV